MGGSGGGISVVGAGAGAGGGGGGGRFAQSTSLYSMSSGASFVSGECMLKMCCFLLTHIIQHAY